MSGSTKQELVKKINEIERLLAELKVGVARLGSSKAEKSQEAQKQKGIKKEDKEPKERVSLGVVDSRGDEIFEGDEVSYEATPSTKAGHGLAHSITRGEDPFLRIKPIYLKKEGKTYTKYQPVLRKPYNVDLIL